MSVTNLTQRLPDRLPLLCTAVVCLLTGLDCGSSTPGPQNTQPTWQLALHDLPGGLLSVSGTSPDNVYAVGTDPQDGLGPLVLWYDGQEWTRLDSGASGNLWWISDTPIADAFFMTGENGLILRYQLPEVLPGLSTKARGMDGEDASTWHEIEVGTFEQLETPGTETIYGVWGREPDDIYAVGGDESNFDRGGVIWHFDGQQWTVVDLTDVDPDGLPVLFKVWGRSGTEIYVVGAHGIILRYDGTTWTRLDSSTPRTLFGVYGDNARVVACGGPQNGVIVEDRGNGFQDVTPEGAFQMNGASVTPTGEAFTAGREGAVAADRGSGWELEDTGLNLAPNLHFHGPWSDPDGGFWAVGGDLEGAPVDEGMIVYYGTENIGTSLSE